MFYARSQCALCDAFGAGVLSHVNRIFVHVSTVLVSTFE